MGTPLEHKRIVLGVSGSIAAYKAAELASGLTQAGAKVDAILTEAALEFVTPLTFQSVTGRRAYTEADLWGGEGHVLHISLGKNADLMVVAPATANTIAKLALGLADNLLTITALAATCPLLVAPAMDGGMFSHPATQSNLEVLRGRGVTVAGPATGHLASGMQGEGRMLEAGELLGCARWLMSHDGPLAGKVIVVTAGGTQEPIDPVRAVTNRSSGKQGFALAQAALDLGAEVTLIYAPTGLELPFGAHYVNVQTAQEMLEAVMAAVPQADALLMAAAVADFRPADPARNKIKKESGLPQIQLEPTADILLAVAEHREQTGWPRCTVGFAAETQDLLDNARAKLQSKKLDLIVANDILQEEAGFGADTNQVTLLFPGGQVDALPLMSKAQVSNMVLEWLVNVLLSEK